MTVHRYDAHELKRVIEILDGLDVRTGDSDESIYLRGGIEIVMVRGASHDERKLLGKVFDTLGGPWVFEPVVDEVEVDKP